jgi:hypothetical protein
MSWEFMRDLGLVILAAGALVTFGLSRILYRQLGSANVALMATIGDGRSQPVDATRGQLAINNDGGLPHARPNAFSKSLRNQLSHNVIFSAVLVPPRNH